MHRSGTSAMAGLLHQLGLSAGRELLPADRFNSKGYFEDSEFYALNKWFFETLGIRWDTVFLLNPQQPLPELPDHMNELKMLLSNRIEDNASAFLIKDPRICILAPYYLQACANLNIEPIIVILLRSPDEVARSLFIRSSLDEELSTHLWLYHNLAIERNTRKNKRIYVSHQELIQYPNRVIEAILKEMALTMPTGEIYAASKKAIDPSLQHHKTNSVDELQPFVQTVFRSLISANEKKSSKGHQSELNANWVAYTAYWKLFCQPITTILTKELQVNRRKHLGRVASANPKELNLEKMEIEKKTTAPRTTDLENVITPEEKIEALTEDLSDQMKQSQALQRLKKDKEYLEQIQTKKDLEISQLVHNLEMSSKKTEEQLQKSTFLQGEVLSLKQQLEAATTSTREQIAGLHHLMLQTAATNRLYQAFMTSWRWKIGNTVITYMESILLRRRGQKLAILELATNLQQHESLLRVLIDKAHDSLKSTKALLPYMPIISNAEAHGDEFRSLHFSTGSKLADPLRITIITPSTNISGGTKRLITIAHLLQERGHTVTLVRQYSGRPLDWYATSVPVLDIPFSQDTNPKELSLCLPDADILITYGNNRANSIVAKMPRQKGIKYTLFMHFGAHDLDLDIANAKLVDFHILCTTAWVQKQLEKHSNHTTIRRIGFGVHSDQFYPPKVPNRRFAIGTLSHQHPWKGTHLVIEAWNLLTGKPEFQGLKLILVGQETKTTAHHPNIEYHQDPSQTELKNLYGRCMVWITASETEGIGMCSVEAMLCKTPLVTTDTGGSQDFCNSENSILVERTSMAIAAAIENLLRNPLAAKEMADRAYKDILQHNWSNSIDELEQLLSNDINEDNPCGLVSTCYTLTIGIPIRNQLEYIERCLSSIQRHTQISHEIVLIDDASNEPEVKSFLQSESLRENVSLIRHEEPRGFPHNCNLIASFSRGQYICLLNSDTVVSPNWAELLIATLRKDNNLLIVGPSTSYGVAKNYSETAQQLHQYHESRFDVTDADIEHIAQEVFTEYGSHYEKTEYINGFCMMVDRRLFSTVGFFDTQFGLGSREEVQMVERLRALGYEVAWVKGAYVHHFGHRSFERIEESQGLWETNRILHMQTKSYRRNFLLPQGLILFVYNGKKTSSTRKRTFEPQKMLRRFTNCISIHWSELDENHFASASVVVLQRIGGLNEIIDNNFPRTVDKWKRKYPGTKVVYDLDDYVINSQKSIPKRLISIADVTTVSTPHLQKLLAPNGNRVEVLPNSLDLFRYLKVRQKRKLSPHGESQQLSKRLRILSFSLAGAGLSEISQVARILEQEQVGADFICYGSFGKGKSLTQSMGLSVPQNMSLRQPIDLDNLFEELLLADYLLNWHVHPIEYFEQLKQQYGLKENEFNDFIDSKSELKAFKAGISRTLLITTRRPKIYSTYIQHGVNGLLAETPREFANLILQVEKDPAWKNLMLNNAESQAYSMHISSVIILQYLSLFSEITTT